MNYNTLIVFDLETGSTNGRKTQPTQIAAIALHSQKLTVEPNGMFNSEICPILDDEKAIAMGLDPVQDKALEITRKTRAALATAPPLRLVWENFTTWVNKFNYRKSSFTSPIPCGYNINGFDMKIVDRLCGELGPSDKEGNQGLFNPIWKIDLMDMFFSWTEHNPDVKKRNLAAMMDFMGYPASSKEGTHDALNDVKITANILIKILRMQRDIGTKTNWNTAFADGELYIK